MSKINLILTRETLSTDRTNVFTSYQIRNNHPKLRKNIQQAELFFTLRSRGDGSVYYYNYDKSSKNYGIKKIQEGVI